LLLGFAGSSNVRAWYLGQLWMKVLRSAYHLTELVRITLWERSQVASEVCQIAHECRKAWPLAEIYYCGIFPCFVERCCDRKDYMSVDDPMVINNSRKELDREIENQLLRWGMDVRVVHWYEMYV
jgi:hypothetical protein